MKNIFKKFFEKKKIVNQKYLEFEKLKNQSEVKNVFDAISNFSSDSEIRYVGGCIRKILNNEKVDDIDLSTNIRPEETILALKKNQINFFETGIKHGTITAVINQIKFEITSLRKDINTDGRHAEVEFSKNWKEDAIRRDFTFNSIYADLDGNLFDPFNGIDDLKNGNVKFIGDANLRIKEDYLRILRYIRFFLNYSNNDHDQNIKKIIKKNIVGIKKLSNERLLDELKKITLSNGFLKLSKDNFSLEILLLVFPELINIKIFENLNNYAQNNISRQDFIFLLSLMIVDNTNNVDYFLYKFNVSNEAKKRINFIKNFISQNYDKKYFSENNLWKIFYIHGKQHLLDIINFKLYTSKNLDKKLVKLKDLFISKSKPEFPIKAQSLIEEFNLKEGIELGRKLKEIENLWIENNFNISKKQIEKIARN
tara:strand:- start:1298 stop:2572 length:1275 start_codon:yes stop_codon:yes gene_type:complete